MCYEIELKKRRRQRLVVHRRIRPRIFYFEYLESFGRKVHIGSVEYKTKQQTQYFILERSNTIFVAFNLFKEIQLDY